MPEEQKNTDDKKDEQDFFVKIDYQDIETDEVPIMDEPAVSSEQSESDRILETSSISKKTDIPKDLPPKEKKIVFTKEDFISVLYFLVPFICNLAIAIGFFLIIELPFSFFESDESSSQTFLIIITVTGLAVAIVRNFLNYFIPNRLKRFYTRQIRWFHWGIATLVYFILMIIIIFTLQAIFPFLKDILFWGAVSLLFVTSFDLYLVMFGSLILIGEASGISGEGLFMYVILVYIVFLIFFYPSILFPNLFVFMGYHLGKKRSDLAESNEEGKN